MFVCSYVCVSMYYSDGSNSETNQLIDPAGYQVTVKL